MFRAHELIVRRAKLYYTVSEIQCSCFQPNLHTAQLKVQSEDNQSPVVFTKQSKHKCLISKKKKQLISLRIKLLC